MMKYRIAFFLASIPLASCSSGGGNSGDKYQYNMGQIIEHASRISDDQAQGQKLGGAEAVLLSVPIARKDVKDAWFVGTGLGWLAQWSQSHANAEISLAPIRQGLCQMNAGELHVSGEDVCGYGSYLKPEGNWLANNIAPLSLKNSRDFVLNELDEAERYSCAVLQNYTQTYPQDKIQHPELMDKCKQANKQSKVITL